MPVSIDWTPDFESQVLASIESGLTLRATGEKHGISASAIIRRVQSSEDFAKQYARVIDIRTDADCDALADEIAQVPEKHEHGVDSGWVAWQRVRVDTMKWLLSKRNPKKYGDKVQQELSGPDGGPIQAAVTVEFVKPKA